MGLGHGQPDVVSRLPVAKLTGTRILLAEGNPVNREVAVGMLEQLDCQVVAVEHGRFAVTETQRTRFDLILMDCQMPQMDGFAAAQAIRQYQGALAPPQRIPIVALTANGDRERCLDVGMDDHLSKPFTLHQLEVVIQRWLQAAPPVALSSSEGLRQEAFAPPAFPHPVQSVVLEWDVLDNIRSLQRNGRPDFLAQLIEKYVASSKEHVATIRRAVASGDASALWRAAHALKSSSGMMGAFMFAELCRELETLGRAATLDQVPEVLSKLEASYPSVCAALEAEAGKGP